MRSVIGRTLALTAMTALVVACTGGGAATPTPPASTPAPTTTPGGGANPSPNAEPVKLTYFTFSAAPDPLKDLDAIIAAFNVEPPNVTIEVQTAAYADYFTKLQTAVAGGTAPDTFELNYENFVS